jgi:hypothetical protein
VVGSIAQGRYPDLESMDPAPSAATVQAQSRPQAVPPRLIGVVRHLIELIERPAPGRAAGDNPEAARDGTGEDWNTRLGVPQYRTQSDNLASPEATCSVTSMAMVLERLGYGRPQIMAAIDRELRRQYREDQGSKGDPTQAELEAVVLPDDYFRKQVASYLEEENGEAERYQRPRGGSLTKNEKNDPERVASASAEYEDSAQMEDLLDFLRYLKKKTWGARTEFLGLGNQIIDALDASRPDRPPMIQIDQGKASWPQVKERIKACLEGGGAAMVSFHHKGFKEGSHIITVQSVEDEGLTVDDPYGGIRDTYRRGDGQDAFAPEGKSKRTDAYRNVIDRDAKGETDSDGVGDDWKVEYGQQLQDGESLGNSHFVPDSVFAGTEPSHDSWFYVRLFSRPSATTIDSSSQTQPSAAASHPAK